MADRPILFSGPMIKALRGGRKTQTRRVANWKRGVTLADIEWSEPDSDGFKRSIPLRDQMEERYSVSDRLWVREAWRTSDAYDDLRPSEMGGEEPIRFEADGASVRWGVGTAPTGRYRPGMFMPRWASRLTLVVTEVRVERLQDISEEDADAEVFGGDFPHIVLPTLFPDADEAGSLTISECFARLWDSINGERPGCAWSDNPWVVAVSFEAVRSNIDNMPAQEAA